MHRRLTHLGLQSVEVVVQDARKLGETLPQVADRVLVDAPCTGLGVLRRRPEIKWRGYAEHPPGVGGLQRAVLGGGAGAGPGGGVVIYSVWTTEPGESGGGGGPVLGCPPDYGI